MLNKHNEQNEFIKKIFLWKSILKLINFNQGWGKGDIFLKRELFFYGSEFPQPPPDIDLSEVKEEKRVLFVMTMKEYNSPTS